jgi:hypothetical protein
MMFPFRQHLLLFLLGVLVPMSSSRAADKQWLVFEGEEGPGRGKHIVLISGDEEYRSEESLPMLGKILSKRHGFKCTVLFSLHPDTGVVDPTYQNNLPGLEALRTADLMIVATRFRTPSEEQMRPFEEYLDSGKPVIGIRTATHGFQGKWEYFGMKILGEEWAGHHGHHKQEGTRAVIESANADHPVLRSVTDVFGPTDVYGVTHLTGVETVLLRGAVTESLDPNSSVVAGEKNEPMMPLAWLREYESPSGKAHGQAFCTTAGASIDFLNADLRRLIINTSFFLTGIEVPANANVEPVDAFTPSFYGFFKEEGYWLRRGARPADFDLGQTPAPVDPPGTPEWKWR